VLSTLRLGFEIETPVLFIPELHRTSHHTNFLVFLSNQSHAEKIRQTRQIFPVRLSVFSKPFQVFVSLRLFFISPVVDRRAHRYYQTQIPEDISPEKTLPIPIPYSSYLPHTITPLSYPQHPLLQPLPRARTFVLVVLSSSLDYNFCFCLINS